jgi:hypothetical protein
MTEETMSASQDLPQDEPADADADTGRGSRIGQQYSYTLARHLEYQLPVTDRYLRILKRCRTCTASVLSSTSAAGRMGRRLRRFIRKHEEEHADKPLPSLSNIHWHLEHRRMTTVLCTSALVSNNNEVNCAETETGLVWF